MNKTMVALEIYQDKKGKTPFIEWLESIKEIVDKTRILEILSDLDSDSLGEHKSVGDDILECSILLKNDYRIYFTKINYMVVESHQYYPILGNRVRFVEAEKISLLLLYGGNGQLQDENIKNAKKYWQEYKKETSVSEMPKLWSYLETHSLT